MSSRSRVGALLALTAVIALAAPSAGVATDRGRPFTLGFESITRDDVPIKVKNFVFKNLPMKCDEGNLLYSAPKRFSIMEVNDRRKFSGKEKFSGVKVKVTGKYKRNLTKVKGTIKAKGKTDGYTDCSSEKLRWKAS